MTKKVGYIAIVGRPNVGKSTLMNRILGQKVSITSRRPQTTRERILGIKTTDQVQAIYVDTPGLHKGEEKALNRFMNRQATQSVRDVDVAVFVVEGVRWTDEDDYVCRILQNRSVPLIVVVNKVDRIEDKEQLLPHLGALQEKLAPHAIIPLSAKHGQNIEALEKEIAGLLPESEQFFPDDQITDRTDRFLTAEIIREKLMRSLGQELPYELSVEIEQFKEDDTLIDIAAIIWVARDGQKAIVIGKGGEKLKQIGTEARMDLQGMFEKKIFLQLWVKVKTGWTNDLRAMRSLGYRDE